MDEAELVGRAQRADQMAWTVLVTTYQGPVYRLAYLILGNPAEAEDIAQETFVRAFRSLDRFDVSRPLRPWLLAIAANLSRNRRRSAARYLAALQRSLAVTRTVAPDEPRLSAEAMDAQELWQATRRLTQDDQEIIYLRFFLELPVAEAAEILRVPAGTVKSRTHRALGRLREVVERQCPGLIEEYGDEQAAGRRQA